MIMCRSELERDGPAQVGVTGPVTARSGGHAECAFQLQRVDGSQAGRHGSAGTVFASPRTAGPRQRAPPPDQMAF
jgi:hypothetical protein